MSLPLNISSPKATILARLRRDILQLQNFTGKANQSAVHILPAVIENAFPNNEFPLGAVHEFICNGVEDTAATGGFVSGMLASIMQKRGAAIWITSSRTIFPPALASFGIQPDKIIFVELTKEKEILWAMEEALKCDSLSAVIGELKELSFTNSRRLQLAVEQSRVTGFILRNDPRSLNTTACVTRWKITSLPGEESDMPGVGFPKWNVELLKVRNGRPGSWEVAFRGKSFKHISKVGAITPEQKKRTG
jgi:protein ImuA